MQIECGIAWSVLLLTTIRVITVVRMLWTHEAHHISICFFYHNTNVKGNVFFRARAEKGIA